MDTLPPEILRFILNGAPSVRSDRCSNTLGRPSRPRPFIDARWRFSLRAVCHLWRDIVDATTASEAFSMCGGQRNPSRPPAPDRHWVHSKRCHKWAQGRLVSASAVAEWISSGNGPWPSRDANAVWRWCRDYAGASHKGVMAAMIASDARWAVSAALTIGWKWARFASSDPDVMASRLAGEYDWWDDDVHGDANALDRALWRVAIRWASRETAAALAARKPPPYCVWSLQATLDYACRVNRRDIVATLVDEGAQPNPQTWSRAARAPSCFEVLLAAGYTPPPLSLIIDDPATKDPAPVVVDWLQGAVVAGRWHTLAVCDAYRVPFDAVDVFLLASGARRTKVLEWLWRERPAVQRTDLVVAALRAIDGHHDRSRERAADSIAWLCDVAGYVPTEDELRVLVAKARTAHCVACALYLLRRWPRRVLSLGEDPVDSLFRQCLSGGVACLGAFLAVVADHGRSLGADALDRIDLWRALAPPKGSMIHRRWTSVPSITALMRVAYQLSLDRTPCARDVSQIDAVTRAHPRVAQCHCLRHGVTNRNLTRTSIESDDDTPCTDAAALEALAPLAVWCRPRPVSAERLFPGWQRDTTVPTGALDRIADDAFCRQTVSWLGSVGLLSVVGA